MLIMSLINVVASSAWTLIMPGTALSPTPHAGDTLATIGSIGPILQVQGQISLMTCPRLQSQEAGSQASFELRADYEPVPWPSSLGSLPGVIPGEGEASAAGSTCL